MTPPDAAPAIPRRIVTCPACKGDSIYASDNPSRPFCSARCKNADFGAWASEQFVMEAKPPADWDGSDPNAH